MNAGPSLTHLIRSSAHLTLSQSAQDLSPPEHVVQTAKELVADNAQSKSTEMEDEHTSMPIDSSASTKQSDAPGIAHHENEIEVRSHPFTSIFVCFLDEQHNMLLISFLCIAHLVSLKFSFDLVSLLFPPSTCSTPSCV